MRTITRREFSTSAAALIAAGRAPELVKRRQQQLSPDAVTGIGGFAGQRFSRNTTQYLKRFEVERYAAMVEDKKYTAWFWIGEQPGKWLESAIYASASGQDSELRKRAEQLLGRLITAQDADGYLGITDPSVKTARHPMRGMDPYELYFTLHGLVTAHEQWKSEPALRAARRLGDFFVAKVAPGKAEFWPLPKPVTIAGHEVHYGLEGTLLIDPMMRLYQASGDKRYLDWCLWCMNSIDRWSASDTFSNLDKVAAGTMRLGQIQPNVHSHTLHMNLIGFLRIYQATGDPKLLAKAQAVWRSVMRDYRFITGAVSVGEGYKEPHVLPNTGSVAETCASMSWILLNQLMLELTGDSAHADAIERLFWNHMFAAQTLDGDGFRYHCPLNGWKPERYFTGPDCCSASGGRMLSMAPQLIYGQSSKSIYVNQFVPSTGRTPLATLEQRTTYPTGETVAIEVQPKQASNFAVHVRIPGWCASPALKVNGSAIANAEPGTYAVIDRQWKNGDRIELTLPMQTRWVNGEHTNQGLMALERGPVVFALDGAWMGEAEDRALSGHGENLPGLVSAGTELRQVEAPKDALGPAFELDLQTKSGKIKGLMTPFANLGKWYRSEAEKEAGLAEVAQLTGERNRSLKHRDIPYGVWLPRG